MNCVLCGKTVACHITLYELIFGGKIKREFCCESCKKKFERINETDSHRCSYCLKQTSLKICEDCSYWINNGMKLSRHKALYNYNHAMSEFMTEYKYRGNQAYAKVFSRDLYDVCSNLSYDVLVPMPLSKKRLKSRGFNHIECLLNHADLEYHSILKKTNHTRKQVSKSRDDRLKTKHELSLLLNDKIKIEDSIFLLVDDVYTTGSTMLHAKQFLLNEGAKKVLTLTLAR